MTACRGSLLSGNVEVLDDLAPERVLVLHELTELFRRLAGDRLRAHLGVTLDDPGVVHDFDKGVEQLVMACSHAIYSVPKENRVSILLENSAGQKNTVASDFQELKIILDRLYDRTSSSIKHRFGICLDTCHAFASGYDLSSKESVYETMDKFDSQVGYEYLKLIHLNDSRDKLFSRRDRHEHIGLGEIGEEGFKAFLTHKSHENVPLIMETPIDGRRSNSDNLKFVRSILGYD